MRRAVVVMASAQHQPVGLIAKLMQVSESYVRQVIHDFNAHGFEALDPKWSGGRPAKTDRATRDRITQIARCCPVIWAGRSVCGACRSWWKCCGATASPTSAGRRCA
ncbi:helix-turn-helix domain-containing protein [Nocardia sp. No.11]|uniref:helix-turn-helix domain-containing protein n=1 Tax=Nocardia sp. No.11 TaxID=3128861 RepID=UPI00319DC591